MKVGVITDTHDQMPLINKAVQVFNELEVELVIHCGDWISPFTLKPFSQLRCPLKSVFGNNDGDKFMHLQLARKLELRIEQADRFMELDIDGRKAAVLHGVHAGLVKSLAESGNYDVVFYGHSHALQNKLLGKTLLVNAGSFIFPNNPEGKFSIATYESETNSAEHHFLV